MPSARHAPRTNVVLPLPSSPATSTTSPRARRRARSPAASSVAAALSVSICTRLSLPVHEICAENVCERDQFGVVCARRMTLLSLETFHGDGSVRIALEGELDFSSALLLDDELRRAEAKTVSILVLDLSA